MYRNPYKSGGVDNYLLPGAATGDILYVHNVSGDDDDLNSGLDPASPLQTITEALTRCTGGNNDYIIVLNYGDDPTLDATWPIPIDVANVQLIAASCDGFNKTMVPVVPNGNFGCFSIDASNVRVQGFYFEPGASGAGITFSGNVGEPSIRDCFFYGGTYGVHSPNGGVGWGLSVQDCTFLSHTSHGIYINDDPATTRHLNNVFILTVDNSTGIEIVAGGNVLVFGNRFTSSDATLVAGWGITVGALVTAGMFDGNVGMVLKAAPGATPFVDNSADGNWGVNYGGITAIYAT